MLTPRPRRLAALFALAIVALLVVAAWRMRLWPLGPDGAASVGQTTDETGPPSIESAERAALKGRGSDTLPPRVPVSPSRRGPPGLFGVVLSADDDRPIPGARVTATRQDGGARADVETGRDGRFELGPAISSSDAHRLVVAKDGFARFVELRALASVDARMIRLQRGGFIEGRVTEGGRGASFDVWHPIRSRITALLLSTTLASAPPREVLMARARFSAFPSQQGQRKWAPGLLSHQCQLILSLSLSSERSHRFTRGTLLLS